VNSTASLHAHRRMISQSPGAVSKRKPEIMPHGRDKQVSRQGKPSGMSLLEAAFPSGF